MRIPLLVLMVVMSLLVLRTVASVSLSTILVMFVGLLWLTTSLWLMMTWTTSLPICRNMLFLLAHLVNRVGLINAAVVVFVAICSVLLVIVSLAILV